MDFGAWGQVLVALKQTRKISNYSYFVFLNSSTRGPYLPKYFQTEPWWNTYTRLLNKEIFAVGSSLVCLPEIDHGGPGPRLESWAFALTRQATMLMIEHNVFSDHGEKFGR